MASGGGRGEAGRVSFDSIILSQVLEEHVKAGLGVVSAHGKPSM